MSTDIELLKSLSTKVEKEEAPDIKAFILRNLKYWHVLLLLLMAGVALSWLYLRYTPKSYQADAMLAIKKDPALMSEGGLNISLMDDKVALEKEVEILKSPDAIEETVKALGLYTDVKSKGRLLKVDKYGDDNPFIITIEKPDAIVKSGPFDVIFVKGQKDITFNGKSYAFDQWYSFPWGRTQFKLNPKYNGPDKEDLELSFVPVEAVRKSISLRLSADTRTKLSELIIMSISDNHARRAVDILETMVKEYDKITVSNKKAGYLSTYEFIDDRLSTVEKELSGVENEIQKYRSSNEIIDLSSQGNAYLESIQSTDAEVAKLNLQLDMVNRAKSYLEAGPAESGSLPAMIDVGDGNLSSQIAELNKIDLDLNKQLQLSGPDNPRVKVLQEQSKKLRISLSEGLGNLSKNLQTSRNFYASKQAGFNSMLRSIPQKEKGLIDITRQQAIKNGIFSFLLQKREESAIAVAGTTANSQFIRRPLFTGTIRPTALQTLLIAVPFAFFLFFVFISIKEMFRNQLEDRGELERLVGAPIVGELSHLKLADGDESSVVVGQGKQSVEAEQFRDLRTNLNYLGIQKANNVILVTSSMPFEGKTFVSVNLALSIALTGKKVALMCTDFRRPRLSKALGVKAKPGITDYLIGNAKLSEIIRESPFSPSLFVLPEGSLPPNPAELLMGEHMRTLVDELKKDYDYIVFDTPPIGAVTDAKIIAEYVTSCIYVTRIGVTLKNFYPMIKDAYENKKLPNMGIVINGIRYSKLSRYGQRYGYSYENGNSK